METEKSPENSSIGSAPSRQILPCRADADKSWVNVAAPQKAMTPKETSERGREANVPQCIKSYGLACFRMGENGLEVLMVKKKCTYDFIEFSKGKYPAGDIQKNKNIRAKIKSMFSRMTLEEKLDIYTLDFDRIWYRSHFDFKDTKQHDRSAQKFRDMFLAKDGGVYIRQLLNKTGYVREMWELPKGRKDKSCEEDLLCSIREFCEETNISKEAYKVLPSITFNYSYADNGVNYNSKFYAALATCDLEPRIDISNKNQVIEIVDIAWVRAEKVAILCDNNKDLIEPLLGAFLAIKRYYYKNFGIKL